jgi:hypothetical protein
MYPSRWAYSQPGRPPCLLVSFSKAWMDWPESDGLSEWFAEGSLAKGEAILCITTQSIYLFEFILSTCILTLPANDGLYEPRFNNLFIDSLASQEP